MPRHEEFEQLCALAAVGEISPEQHRDLAEHLRCCNACQKAYDEYGLLLHQFPAATDNIEQFLEPGAAVQKALKQRFLARARAEQIQLSNASERRRSRFWPSKLLSPIPASATAGVLLGALALVVIQRQRPNQPGPLIPGHESNVAVASPVQIGSRQVPAAQPSPEEVTASLTLTQFEKKNRELEDQVAATQRQLKIALADKARLELVVAQLTAKDAETDFEKQQKSELLTRTQAELEKAKADQVQIEASLTEQQSRAEEASEQLRLQTASILRERDLLSADRDIRDLMGARNLHIIDVHDADGRGKNKPVFGRVFFTEGKSLIFYAFDLDEKRLINAKYSYHAWGERAGEPTSIKSLGMFFSDDRSLRRWVMKFDKPEELKEIDSVFVTLEPSDNVKKPRGQRLLYAYLSSHVNHP